MRPVFKTKYIIFIILFCIVLFHPWRHAKHYSYLPISEIMKQFLKCDCVYNRTIHEYNANFCSYEHLINNNKKIEISEIRNKSNYEIPLPGGEYIPKKCIPLYKSAIIVTFRNRHEQLKVFLNYIHGYLQNQNIHYRIYLVEQMDDKPFNKGALYNVGYLKATSDGFSCLILHDVDLIPITTGNIYACTKSPRHMSSNIDTFRYHLPYEGLFGGVVSLTDEQYKTVNGMSNLFLGWGGEDDDFYTRVIEHNLEPCRFHPDYSKYTMLMHKKEKASSNRYFMLRTGKERQKTDGLKSLKKYYKVSNDILYTHVKVYDKIEELL